MPACLARGLNTLFQKGHGACNQYLVASWLPCSAPWAWSLSSICVIQKIPSDLGFWDQPPYVELFLFLVQNLAGWDGGTEPLKIWKLFLWGFVWKGFCWLVFFFIPTTMGKQQFLDSNQKGIDFPSESGLEEICSECTKNHPWWQEGQKGSTSHYSEVRRFQASSCEMSLGELSMLVWWYINLYWVCSDARNDTVKELFSILISHNSV